MKIMTIESMDLPDIDLAVKECVNVGQWLLLKNSSALVDSEDAYFLVAGADVFSLDGRGSIIRKMSREDVSLRMDELCYFSDLPAPSSIGNIVAS